MGDGIAPKLLAEFELDKNGQPKYVVDDDEDTRHYKLRLFVEGAPPDTSSVKYFLHPTYFEPERQVLKGDGNFTEYLTSYGDYKIKAVVNRKDGSERISRSLTDALRERYQDKRTDDINSAIQYLKDR